ncbi:hypothetical protein EDD22DRAFT_947948 [Suillus occidentalis]|nr:hypothetical protein EDD22DRAFT_947948 [Suillus occidentalis]
MVECPGCLRNDLSVTGLSQHLAKTKDLHCNAVLAASRSNLHASSSPDLENGLFQPDDEEPPAPLDDDSSDDEDTEEYNEWELPVEEDGSIIPGGELDDPMDDNGADRESRQDVERKPITQSEVRDVNVTYGSSISDTENPYSPFSSQMDWEIAQWAKLRGPSSTAFSDLLSIDGVSECLGLSYKNSRELNGIINKQLPGRPKFQREQIIVALFSDLDFADFLVFAPERHYTDDDETVRLYSDMHTGRWWWNTQKKLDEQKPGATIIPVIISTDKTQVTVFRNKTAYPVYLTIGNIPKDIRRKPSKRAHVLLAYLPTTRLEHITNKASRRRSAANLYHACMARVLSPLEKAGIDGLTMCSGDGISRHCHPLFACFIGDYPKQVLATAVKSTECPKCDIPPDELGSSTAPFEWRDLHAILDALATIDIGDLKFVQACRDAGIKPVIHPYWELTTLCQYIPSRHTRHSPSACGPIEIDARCWRLPPNHHIRLFMKGITGLSRVSGAEHAQICCFLLGIIIDARLPGNLSSARLLRAVRGLLDFLYLAQYPCHSSKTLSLLDEALTLFHDNKQIFVNLGICNNFNLPKLHATPKDAYHATNHKDEFAQMTQWLECKEKIPRPPQLSFDHTQTLMKHPSAKAVSFRSLVSDYGATYFREALTRYIAQQNHSDESLSRRRLEDLAANVLLPFHSVAVYHKIKWLSVDARGHGDPLVTVDSVHVKPCRTGTRRQNDAVPAPWHILIQRL